MNHPEKQLKYSIRKVSVGAASVVIGALYLLMGAGIAHAKGVESAREAERTANPTDPEQSGNGETGNKPDLSNTDAAANTYNAPVAENPLVAPESTKPRTRSKRELPDGDTGETPAGATGTESGENQPTGENSPVLDANRKGETVKTDQPGVHVPKDGETGGDDKNAHLTFDTPGENATVEYMYKIIQNMPDDFQNNERSYLRNMNTLGDALRFKDGKVVKDEDGEKLQDGEIREINEFGGWKAIDGGTFAIGKKNAQGYFTGWYYKKGSTTEKEQGGMLGSDALDRVYVHEQALDRRFKYMLMLAKGRTIANRTDTAQDGSTFEIKTEKRTGNRENLAKLPVKEKDDILQHSPNIEGFNGIEKTFTAFSTKYGSRLKIDFVTGYISDYEGSKGTYRIVVKAIKKGDTDGATKEETIYDHTINRIDGVVENEERYSQGVDLSGFNKLIKKLLTDEHEKKVKPLAEARYKEQHPDVKKPKFSDYKYLMPIITKELAEKDKGAVTYELPIDKDKLQLQGKNSFKEGIPFTDGYTTVANKLNNSFSKTLDPEVQPNSPTWANTSDKKSDGTLKRTDPDRVYEILNFVLPTAKKIIYHADTDQLELQTDPEKVKSHRQELEARLKTKEASLASNTNEEEITKLNKEISALKAAIGSTNAYTYLEARNGSQEAKILGSHMEAKEKPSPTEMKESDYNKYHTNELAAQHDSKDDDGLKAFTAYFVEKENVIRNNVISDEKLSEKITEAIGGDEDKLGKGGYFSTGDIPLDKDVVAYKIQVFAENKKRVGVNKQSPRLQYNLPILADFSVIQDTVEPAKEVSRRIIDKLIEEKKIPEDKGKKIKEEIEKVKKTSELKELLKGSVKVRYVDTTGTEIKDAKYLRTFTDKDGNTANITDKPGEVGKQLVKYLDKSGNPVMVTVKIKDNNNQDQEVSVPKEEETTDNKAGYLGLSYTDTFDKTVDNIISTSDGKRYRVRRSLADNTPERAENSAAAAGELSPGETVVTYVYEEIPESVEDTETKTLTRTIKYVEKGNETHLVSESKTQTVTVSRKVYKNKQTGKVEAEEAWEIPDGTKWEEVVSPKLDGYQNPTVKVGDRYEAKDKVDSVTITQEIADRGNVEETVYYEVDAVKTTETKTITRTIRYVDNVTKQKLKEDVVQTVTLTREKTENKAAGTTTYTEWTKGNWEKVVSPTIDKYTNPSMTEVSSMEVTSDSKNSTITVTYDQGTETTQETKPVTRTIKYVKKDFVDGVEVEVENAQQTNTKAVSFTRTLTRNLVTGETTTGTWSEKQTLEEVKTPVLEGYIADRAKVESSEVTGDSADIEEKVVYRKIGGWIPKEPGKDKPTPIPYPNDPKDPTKPKYPDYPKTPETPGETPNPQPGDPGTPETPATPPVIPYVPGYTPKVPTDPTQPENPDTNPLKPLEPLDPNDPKKGYKVPEIPSDPKKNKEIEYVPNPQKILIKVVNITTGKEVEMPKEKLEFSGVSDQVVGDENKTKVDNKIKALKQRGYTVESTNPITATTKYDRVDDATTGEPSQTYKLVVKEPISIDTDSKTVTRTIKYVKKDLVDGVEVPSEAHATVIDTATFNREVKFNLVTGETTYGKWSEAQTLNKVSSPVLSGYIADRAEVG